MYNLFIKALFIINNIKNIGDLYLLETIEEEMIELHGLNTANHLLYGEPIEYNIDEFNSKIKAALLPKLLELKKTCPDNALLLRYMTELSNQRFDYQKILDYEIIRMMIYNPPYHRIDTNLNLYEVLDELILLFGEGKNVVFDLLSRPNKKTGNYFFGTPSKSWLVCNFDSLLIDIDGVITLAHEYGHMLHHQNDPGLRDLYYEYRELPAIRTSIEYINQTKLIDEKIKPLIFDNMRFDYKNQLTQNNIEYSLGYYNCKDLLF